MTWDTVTSDVVRAWVVALLERGLTPSAVCPKLSAVKSFYRFLLKRGMVSADPAYGVHAPKKAKVLPYFVGERDLDFLLEDSNFSKTFEGILERTVVSMLYATGMRAAELVALDVSDLDMKGSVVSVVGKRRKNRLIPILPELKSLLEVYLAERKDFLCRNNADHEALFVSAQRGMRLTYSALRLMVRGVLSKVTLQSKRSPHVLRHSFATSMLNHSADLQSVKELLGHESLRTTAIYAHTTFEELKKLYNQAHPRA
jgi:integrase/recombinase XerC